MTMDPVIALIKDDPDLMHRLIDAGSREERAAILKELGVALPEAEHAKAKWTELMAISGGAGTATGIAVGQGAASAAAAAAV